jgi:predicted CXXCH cytochrome family protein
MASPPAVIPSAPPSLADGILKWNLETLEATVPLGTSEADFQFRVENVSKETLSISSVHTSCGCTVAKLPATPWALAPGINGPIDVTMNLAGKRGTIAKTLTVITDHGSKILTVRTIIQDPPAGTMSQSDRVANLQIASANRQVVLHGECASCHNPHASGNKKLLLKPDGKLCYECHDDLQKQFTAAKVKHQPVENGECLSCHNPHPMGSAG